MDIEGKAVQKQFATLVGISEPAVSDYVKRGILKKDGTYRQWLLDYCSRQRIQAANNGGENQGDLTRARIKDLKASARLKELKFSQEIKELIPIEWATTALSGWSSYANQEYRNGIKNMILRIENTHSCSIDEKFIHETLEKIMKRIGKFAHDQVKTIETREVK